MVKWNTYLMTIASWLLTWKIKKVVKVLATLWICLFRSRKIYKFYFCGHKNWFSKLIFIRVGNTVDMFVSYMKVVFLTVMMADGLRRKSISVSQKKKGGERPQCRNSWIFLPFRFSEQSNLLNLKSSRHVKMVAIFEILDLLKLISRKMCEAEKF